MVQLKFFIEGGETLLQTTTLYRDPFSFLAKRCYKSILLHFFCKFTGLNSGLTSLDSNILHFPRCLFIVYPAYGGLRSG